MDSSSNRRVETERDETSSIESIEVISPSPPDSLARTKRPELEDQEARPDEQLPEEIDDETWSGTYSSNYSDYETINEAHGDEFSCASDDSTPLVHYDSLPSPVKRFISDEDYQKLSNVEKQKFLAIVDSLEYRDVRALRQLATSKGGLLMDGLRALVWPIMVDEDSIYATSPRPSEQELVAHSAFMQVTLDVDRSIRRFPPSIQEPDRLALQDQLNHLIMRVLILNPSAHYYQGYHDICVTFLLILGEEAAFRIVNSLSRSKLALFMEENFSSTSTALQLIPSLVARESSKLANFLECSGAGNIFALSWVITWFSHVIADYALIGRLFDLFLASSDRHLPIYLTAALVLSQESRLIGQSNDEGVHCDMASVHCHLSKMFDREEDIPFELLIARARTLLKKYPPESLAAECHKREAVVQRTQRQHVRVAQRVKLWIAGLWQSNVLRAGTVALVGILAAIIYVHVQQF